MDAFEKHLSDLKFQEPPDHLREKCLAQLIVNEESNQESPAPIAVPTFWNTWLWPHPRVWGGLAAIWLFCFWLNHWSLPLPSYSRDNLATNHIESDYEMLTVLHYTLAMDHENLDSILEPKTPPHEPAEEPIRPSAFIQRYRPLECAWLDTALDTVRQRDREQDPSHSLLLRQMRLWAAG